MKAFTIKLGPISDLSGPPDEIELAISSRVEGGQSLWDACEAEGVDVHYPSFGVSEALDKALEARLDWLER